MTASSPKDSPRTILPNLERDRRTKVGQDVVGLTPRGRCPAVAATPGSELEASLELADPVEEFAYEHGATVVEPEVPA
jgi:hypothetical protein